MSKMTIHRGLAELKLIDSKIKKKIETLDPYGLKIGESGLVNDFQKQDDFVDAAKSKFKSIQDLIKRKVEIKNAIVKANATTEITVGKQKMTIAEAITSKDIIVMKKQLASKIISSHTNASTRFTQLNAQIEASAIKLAEAALQKDNIKIQDTDAIAITEPFLKKNKFFLVDPSGGMKKAEEITDEVEEFLSEIDAVLSESNATTFIEIED